MSEPTCGPLIQLMPSDFPGHVVHIDWIRQFKRPRSSQPNEKTDNVCKPSISKGRLWEGCCGALPSSSLGWEKSSPGCWRFCRALSRMIHIQCPLTPPLHGSEGTSHSSALQIGNLACPHPPSPVGLLTCEVASVLLSASVSSSANSKAENRTSDRPWPSGRWQPPDTGIAGRAMARTLGYILGTVIFRIPPGIIELARKECGHKRKMTLW